MIDKHIETFFHKCFWDNQRIHRFDEHECGVVYFDLYINFQPKRVVLCKDDYINQYKNTQANIINQRYEAKFDKYNRYDARDILTVATIEKFFKKPITYLDCNPLRYYRCSCCEESIFVATDFCGGFNYRDSNNPFISSVFYYKVSDYHNIYAVYKIRDIISSIDKISSTDWYEWYCVISRFLYDIILPYIELKCSKFKRTKLLPVCHDIIASFSMLTPDEVQIKLINLFAIALEQISKSNKKQLKKTLCNQ